MTDKPYMLRLNAELKNLSETDWIEDPEVLIQAAKAYKALLTENELLKNQVEAHQRDADRAYIKNDRYRWALCVAKNALFKEKGLDNAYQVVCKALEVQQ